MPRRIRSLDDPHGLVEITTRTIHGRYLMCPSEKVNDIINGVVGRGQAKYEVTIYTATFLSNHYHLMAKMRDEEQMSRFTGFVNANIAKELGRLYDWREKFWGRRYHSASILYTEEDQIRRFMYILENGCKEGLVDSPLDWPGVNAAGALCRGDYEMPGTWYDRTAQYRASLRGVYEESASPEIVQLTPLPFLQDRSPEEQRAWYVNAVREVEHRTAQMHKDNRTTSIGARAVLRQKPHDKPKAFKPSPAPLFHAADPEGFWAMYNARKAKETAYRAAAERLKRGETDVEFPEGCFPPRLPFVKPRTPT